MSNKALPKIKHRRRREAREKRLRREKRDCFWYIVNAENELFIGHRDWVWESSGMKPIHDREMVRRFLENEELEFCGNNNYKRGKSHAILHQ